jgi:hypothetical protein
LTSIFEPRRSRSAATCSSIGQDLPGEFVVREQRSAHAGLIPANDLGEGRIQLVFLELPKYDASRPPQTAVEKWAYLFREAANLTMVPEVLAEHPFLDALDAARTATFLVGEWDVYIDAGMAVQNKRGALAVAEKRGREIGLRQGREAGLRQSIEALCDVLDIELTDARRHELASLDATGLRALLARLGQHKHWA